MHKTQPKPSAPHNAHTDSSNHHLFHHLHCYCYCYTTISTRGYVCIHQRQKQNRHGPRRMNTPLDSEMRARKVKGRKATATCVNTCYIEYKKNSYKCLFVSSCPEPGLAVLFWFHPPPPLSALSIPYRTQISD